MPVPSSERVIFEPNPLVEVSCELLMERLLRLESERPIDLQEAIRADFPRLEVHSDDHGLVTYDFISEDRLWMFSINATTLRLSTTEYIDREGFQARFRAPLQAVSKIYDRDQANGFRLIYQDVINRHDLGLDEVPYAELLKPGFAGELGEAAMEESDFMELMRFVSLRLERGRADITHGFAQDDQERRVYVIRTELSTPDPLRFDELAERLAAYHDQGGYIFRWAISERLKNHLTPS